MSIALRGTHRYFAFSLSGVLKNKGGGIITFIFGRLFNIIFIS
jgi:hypothetical protein